MATQKNDVLRFKVDSEKLWGIYRGVVEDRIDPLKLGRVRVRVMGVHTEQQVDDGYNKSPWEELCWAQPVNPNFEGSMSGMGAYSVPLKGSHVMVFFENGNMMQPRYFGTVPGFPIDANKYSQLEKQDGYRDPDVIYPLDDWIEEQDWPRLARREKLAKTYLSIKEDWLDLAVPIAFGGEWDEQPPMYETKYPDGNVFSTHDEWDINTNIVIELDATPGSPRFAWWHPSGSYMEVNKEGRMTFRNKLHRWDICDGICQEHYMSVHHRCVDDDMTLILQTNEFREVLISRWTEIHVNESLRVDGESHKIIVGNDFERYESNKNRDILGTYISRVAENKHETVVLDMLKLVGGAYHLTVGNNFFILVDGNYSVGADGSLALCSPQIEIGNVGSEVYIGEEVWIGPIVHLGADEGGVATCPSPEEPYDPVAPVFDPAPPGPADTPDFIPPDEITVMPIPSCP